MLRRSIFAAVGVTAAGLALAGSGAAQQPPIKIALIASKTGPLEAYARQTEAGFMLGLEYATQGKMEIDGRKIQVIVKDDQLKPDMGKAALEQAYGDDKVDIAVVHDARLVHAELVVVRFAAVKVGAEGRRVAPMWGLCRGGRHSCTDD